MIKYEVSTPTYLPSWMKRYTNDFKHNNLYDKIIHFLITISK